MFSWRANDTSKRLYWYFGNSSRSFKEHANSNKWCLSDNFVVLHCTVLINKLFITILQCQETKWLPSNYLVSTHSGTWDYSFHLNCSLQLVRINSESSSSSNSRSSLKYSVAAFLFHIDLKKFTERHFETNWSNFPRALVCIRQAYRPLWRHYSLESELFRVETLFLHTKLETKFSPKERSFKTFWEEGDSFRPLYLPQECLMRLTRHVF
jgi:hypothetical protein